MRAQLMTQVIEREEKSTVEEEIKTLTQEQELLKMQVKALVGKQEAMQVERRQLEGDPAPLAEAWAEDPLPEFEDDDEFGGTEGEEGQRGGVDAAEESKEGVRDQELEVGLLLYFRRFESAHIMHDLIATSQLTLALRSPPLAPPHTYPPRKSQKTRDPSTLS